MPYEWSHEQQAKLWFSSFFRNFNNFVSRFDFQNVYVMPRLPNFTFLASKNKNASNKNFRKNLQIKKLRYPFAKTEIIGKL